jgi:ABC-type uncharacterized transport system involved in gliding motility auxiliary subunit
MNRPTQLIALILLIVGLVLVNFIASFLPGQIDFTSSKLYTLSPGTQALLDKIEEPITLEFYFSRDAEGIPILFKNYATRIEELLKQYEGAASGGIELRIVDPRPDTKEEEAAIRVGISGQTLGNGDTLFFGLVAIQADQEKAIPVFNLQREPFLEYDISRAIYRVQQYRLPRLGILSSLPLIRPVDPGYMMPSQQLPEDWVVIQELRNFFEISGIDKEAESIEESIDVLAVIHPQQLPDKMAYAIDQFLLSGRPVLLAVDPSSTFQKGQIGQQAMMMGGGANTSSNLPRLFETWGIEYDPSNFVADLSYASMVQSGMGNQPIRYPAWLSIDKLNTESPPTAQLDNMLLIETGSFSLKEESDLALTPLIKSSTQSDALNASLLNFTPPDALIRQITPTQEEKIIAAIISGKFHTAFPGGKPIEEEEPKDENSADIDFLNDIKVTAEPGLKESGSSSTLMLIADSDFMADQFSVEKLNFLGFQSIRPLNDNLNFVSNILEFLSGSEDLISLRGKGTAVRPFIVVRELETKAQERYQMRYDELQNKLGDVQSKLNGLLEQQQDQQNLIASPEVRKAIENFRNQEAETRGELREIRKRLREDIEKLNRTLALFNLITVPVLIGFLSLYFFRKRSKRQKTIE